MGRAPAYLFVGLTLFAAGASIGTGSFSGNEALAASRGYSPNISQGRTIRGGYRPTSVQKAKGMPYTDWKNTKQYTGHNVSRVDTMTDLQKARRGKGWGPAGSTG